MKKFFVTIARLTLASVAFSSIALAEASNALLDQSQNVLFDSFSLSTFSLQLLQNKNKFNTNTIIFGGSTEFDLQRWQGDKITPYPLGQIYQQGQGLYWTQASFDVFANVNAWTSLFFSIADNHIGSNNDNANYFYLPHAFMLLGNSEKTSFYSTIGVNSIPFGVFAGSGASDTPLTAAYFNPAQAPQLSLAFNNNGWNGAATVYNDETNHNTHFAYNLVYNKNSDAFSYSIGAGYLTNLSLSNSNSATIQAATLRHSFDLSKGKLGNIIDINASGQYKEFMLAAEYDRGSNKVNGNQQLAEAYAITGNYFKSIFGKETTFGITRSMALHLKDVPTPLTGYNNLTSAFTGLKDTWAINVSYPVIKNSWLGLDLQRASTNKQAQIKSAAHTYTATLDLMVYL